MSGNLKELKARIRSAKNIAQIAKAMEMISASKIRKAKQSVENNRPYAEKLSGIMGKILRSVSERDYAENRYVKPRSNGKKLIIALSPDKGLCGGLVDNIAAKLDGFDPAAHCVITVGKKLEKYAARHGFELKASFPAGTKLPCYESIYPVLETVDKLYLGGDVSEVSVLYTEFRTMFANMPLVRKLLPLDFSPHISGLRAHDYKFEPGASELLNDIITYHVEVGLYNCILNAYSSEQAARMVAMQNAKNNAFDITEFFTLSYNKLRQEKITNEILDITNVMNA